MKAPQNRALQALRRARAWLTAHPELIGRITALVGLIAKLDAAIERLSAASTNQELLRVASLERTATARRIRTELWKYHMVPIVEVARAAAPNDPDLAADVRLPLTPRNDEAVFASAAAMAKAVGSKQQLFIDHGLATDFVAQLVDTADTLRQLIDGRGATRAERTGTRSAIEAAVREGKNALRLITNALNVSLRAGETLDEWKSAKRIHAQGSSAPETSEPTDVKTA